MFLGSRAWRTGLATGDGNVGGIMLARHEHSECFWDSFLPKLQYVTGGRTERERASTHDTQTKTIVTRLLQLYQASSGFFLCSQENT